MNTPDIVSLALSVSGDPGGMTFVLVAPAPAIGDFDEAQNGLWLCYENPEGWRPSWRQSMRARIPASWTSNRPRSSLRLRTRRSDRHQGRARGHAGCIRDHTMYNVRPYRGPPAVVEAGRRSAISRRCCVDDGSTDGTLEAAPEGGRRRRSLLILSPGERGASDAQRGTSPARRGSTSSSWIPTITTRTARCRRCSRAERDESWTTCSSRRGQCTKMPGAGAHRDDYDDREGHRRRHDRAASSWRASPNSIRSACRPRCSSSAGFLWKNQEFGSTRASCTRTTCSPARCWRPRPARPSERAFVRKASARRIHYDRGSRGSPRLRPLQGLPTELEAWLRARSRECSEEFVRPGSSCGVLLRLGGAFDALSFDEARLDACAAGLCARGRGILPLHVMEHARETEGIRKEYLESTTYRVGRCYHGSALSAQRAFRPLGALTKRKEMVLVKLKRNRSLRRDGGSACAVDGRRGRMSAARCWRIPTRS